MIWTSPAALFGLAAVAAPILIHLLVQRRAERLRFPTLRFLAPTRLARARRRLLDDAPLLAVRASMLALAAVALAGPILATASRRDAWSRRIVRAVVVDGAAGAPAPSSDAAVHEVREFRGPSLADGIRRAVAWLDHAPPAKRELLVVSPLPIGAITAADVARVPAGIGVTFERSGRLPAQRTVALDSVRTAAGTIARTVTLDGDRTSVRESASGNMALPIEIAAPPAARPVVDAALEAVLSRRIPMAAAGRRVRMVIGEAPPTAAEPIREPWMADAVARLTRDADLRDAASRAGAPASGSISTRAPWILVAGDATGRPLVAAAAASGALVVVSGAPAPSIVTPILLRAAANAVAPGASVGEAEVVPIPDAQLRAWTRPAAQPSPRTAPGESDDRRWLWLIVLGLFGIEEWMRRRPRAGSSATTATEAARVA